MEVSPKINDTTGNSTNGPRVDGLKPCFPVMLSLEAGFEMHRGLKCMFTNDLAPESLRHNTSFLQSRQDLLPDCALIAGIFTPEKIPPPKVVVHPNETISSTSAEPTRQDASRHHQFSSPFAGDLPNLHELEQFLGALPEIFVQLKVKSLGTLKIVDTYQLCLILPQTLVVCYPLLNRPSC